MIATVNWRNLLLHTGYLVLRTRNYLKAAKRWAKCTVALAIVHPAFEPRLAWLAFLHVSRPYGRRGAAQALWNAAADIAGAADAESIYVSATPTASAVGFYLRQHCHLARPVHPDLFAAEPDDIHFVCSLN